MASATTIGYREQRRKAFQKDALQAWNEYRRNGLHLALEDGDAWLTKLEAGEDANIPACHT